jgi:hypothetical protein
MPYLSVNEFREILLSHSLDVIVKEYVFKGVPYVFRDKPDSIEILNQHLYAALEISVENVTIVGSAKIGFSLSPHSFPRQFSDISAIDVLVVDESLFDKVWLTMLEWNYPRRFHLSGSDWNWSRRRREELYWGWFVPDKIRYEGLSLPHVLKPLRDISTAWFNAFRSLSQYPEFVARDVSGRLYRTWEHALQYHVEGLRQTRDAIQ